MVTIAIAIVRLPARVPVTDPRYGGPIFINPGGPGGSGVAKAFKDGPRMQQAADYLSAPDEQTPSPNLNSKYFDIIGFDPRGVNHSTPKLLCFPDSAAREAWQLQESAEGIIGSSEAAFERKWARWGSFVGSCMQRVATDDASDIALHMNTAPVAADILEIAERHAEWRQTQAESWLSSLSGRLSTAGARSSDPNSRESIRTRTEWKRGFERVSYWGISYGSVLASTFAAMFPDRVSRFILDGVEDPQEHYTGVWNSSIIHADSAIDKFFQYCFDAGPKKCAMYDERGPDAMRTDFNSLLADIKVNALPVPASRWRGPEVITYSDIMKAFKDSLYTPIQSFPALARVVSDVASRDGHSFADYKRFKSTPFARSKQCEAEGPYTTACMRPGEWQDEAEVGVQCGDGNNSIGETKERFLEYRRNLKNQRWSIRPKWRYSGPFEANTSHPLLMIANTLDPITPAKK
ncbi:hypothetical protein DIS24_g10709 [Lasiodiplodia hormozganensis]|uniref:AB hydrolase-1 domain-containing protein n=1 Tax=Lasiodiplodia hormozganensis TaxID=869390 RepID=A0AA39XNZ8_9PEZI|nr:hypothetical protein DIS24_g10709 [Lasiodiplodia hormozganensis]